MKINIFVSIIKAISAWLHGEGGKHFRTYTYPRIKQITRRVVNLGIYERFEYLYKIVDDTYYKGSIAVEPQDPLEVARLEALALANEDAVSVNADTGAALPRLQDIRSKLLIWKGLEQGNTYRCGTFTMNNMLRSQMLKRGLNPELEVTAIDPLYIATKHGKGQTGTVMAAAIAYLAKKGFPIPSWSPRMTNHNKELTALEGSKTINNAALFAGIFTTGKTKIAYTFDEAVRLDKKLPENWEMQVSIDFTASLKYFGNKVPFLQKINGAYSFTRTGGHSIHGVRHSFSTYEDGEPGFVIIDSAYRSSEDGDRFLKSIFMNYGMVRITFVEFNVDGPIITPTPVPTPTPTPNPGTTDNEILMNSNISIGDDNNAVLALQKYLLSQGYAIPSGPTTYFGSETRVALKAWQDKHFGPIYTGEHWGEISREKFKQLLS